MRAYAQSAGYAEQALNAIRVVQAFGQEVREINNYNRHLTTSKKEGMKVHVKSSVVLGFFFFTMFGLIAYALYMGSIWIEKDIYNPLYDKPYRAGEVFACFFGVLVGMISIGMGASNIKAIAEGKVAGKLAFSIINRTPKIN